MNNNYKIKNLVAGSKFVYGGVSWVLLQKTKAAALCLAEKILFNKAFDENESNDFAESTLYKHLNGEFLDGLAADGADKEAFLPFKVDLTADDGLKDYGSVTGKVSLITCDLYRKHRYIIPNADGWWWTATPWSTASNGYSFSVRGVSTSGALGNYSAGYGNIGVRPLCNLASSILVSVTDLKDYAPAEEPEAEQETVADENRKPEPKESTNRYNRHKEICGQLNNTYIAKNIDYGNSFGDMFHELGIITAVTRIGDKYNRIKALVKNGAALVKEESIKDTLLDMANYCIMTVIEMEAKQ